MNTTTTTGYAAAYYGDSENVWTPNRARVLERRMAATKRLALRASLEKARRAAVETGVLDASDPGHVIENGARADTYLAGILYVDGTVHLFDRGRQMHSEYAASVGRPGVDCGCDYGDEGWGFYLNDDLTVLPYRVPDTFHARLKQVVAELVKELPGEVPQNWTCPLCGWHQRGDACIDCRKTRKDCEWEAERRDAPAPDPVPVVVRTTQATDFAVAQTAAQKRSNAAKRANASRTPEQRRAAARKAAETRRRRQMERGF